MTIIFTKHAYQKFDILRRHTVVISEVAVRTTIEQPERLDYSRVPLIIAQRAIDNTHVLRVVYKQEFGVITVITFYPGRKKDYEKNSAKK